MADVQEVIAQMEAAADQLEADARKVRAALDMIRRFGLKGQQTNGGRLTVGLVEATGFSKLTSTEAVNRLLDEAPRDGVTVDEIGAGGQRRGKPLNLNTVRWIVAKGQQDGTVERVGRRYRRPARTAS